MGSEGMGMGDGAASGAAAGSSFGPWGALAGGILGAGAGYLKASQSGGGSPAAGMGGSQVQQNVQKLQQGQNATPSVQPAAPPNSPSSANPPMASFGSQQAAQALGGPVIGAAQLQPPQAQTQSLPNPQLIAALQSLGMNGGAVV